MKMVAAFGGSEDAGGDARAPSLDPRSPIGVGDRLRRDDGLGQASPLLYSTQGRTLTPK